MLCQGGSKVNCFFLPHASGGVCGRIELNSGWVSLDTCNSSLFFFKYLSVWHSLFPSILASLFVSLMIIMPMHHNAFSKHQRSLGRQIKTTSLYLFSPLPQARGGLSEGPPGGSGGERATGPAGQPGGDVAGGVPSYPLPH